MGNATYVNAIYQVDVRIGKLRNAATDLGFMDTAGSQVSALLIP